MLCVVCCVCNESYLMSPCDSVSQSMFSGMFFEIICSAVLLFVSNICCYGYSYNVLKKGDGKVVRNIEPNSFHR